MNLRRFPDALAEPKGKPLPFRHLAQLSRRSDPGRPDILRPRRARDSAFPGHSHGPIPSAERQFLLIRVNWWQSGRAIRGSFDDASKINLGRIPDQSTTCRRRIQDRSTINPRIADGEAWAGQHHQPRMGHGAPRHHGQGRQEGRASFLPSRSSAGRIAGRGPGGPSGGRPTPLPPVERAAGPTRPHPLCMFPSPATAQGKCPQEPFPEKIQHNKGGLIAGCSTGNTTLNPCCLVSWARGLIRAPTNGVAD